MRDVQLKTAQHFTSVGPAHVPKLLMAGIGGLVRLQQTAWECGVSWRIRPGGQPGSQYVDQVLTYLGCSGSISMHIFE